MVDILEIIQMVGVDVQDDLRPGPQRKEAIHIFARLCHEILTLAHLDVAVELVEDAAHQHRGRVVSRLQNEAHHGRGRGLAVGTGDRDGDLVVRHDGAQRIRPGNDGDASSSGFRQLRIFHGDRSGIDQQIRIAQIVGVVADKYLSALLFQHLRDGTLLHVRTGYPVTSGQQDLCDAGETDAADADAMHMFIILQIHFPISDQILFFIVSRTKSFMSSRAIAPLCRISLLFRSFKP